MEKTRNSKKFCQQKCIFVTFRCFSFFIYFLLSIGAGNATRFPFLFTTHFVLLLAGKFGDKFFHFAPMKNSISYQPDCAFLSFSKFCSFSPPLELESFENPNGCVPSFLVFLEVCFLSQQHTSKVGR